MIPFIYALVDPLKTGHIRYVGLTTANASRPYKHAVEARLVTTAVSHKVNWIRKLQSEGREPCVIVLEELLEGTTRKAAGEVEKSYIRSLRSIGHRLTNATDGGDGIVNPTAETRAKMRWSAERHADQSQAMKDSWAMRRVTGGKVSPAPWSPEARARNAQLVKEACGTPEAREEKSRIMLEALSTPEARARRSESTADTWARLRSDPVAYAELCAERAKKKAATLAAKKAAADLLSPELKARQEVMRLEKYIERLTRRARANGENIA